jgi:hypothetical protein
MPSTDTAGLFDLRDAVRGRWDVRMARRAGRPSDAAQHHRYACSILGSFRIYKRGREAALMVMNEPLQVRKFIKFKVPT